MVRGYFALKKLFRVSCDQLARKPERSSVYSFPLTKKIECPQYTHPHVHFLGARISKNQSDVTTVKRNVITDGTKKETASSQGVINNVCTRVTGFRAEQACLEEFRGDARDGEEKYGTEERFSFP